MRKRFIVLAALACLGAPVEAQVSIGIGLPGVSIGINLPVYPHLVAVPGYPVYYAPQMNSNYFFYDGMYWVYQGDNWYASSWYNGPWGMVSPQVVPLFVLRVPVRYYRQPPAYFRGWQPDAPPRWGEHWGNDWEQHRSGWDRWDRKAVPPPAPLPSYQRQYSGDRYPRAEQQPVLQSQHYRYEPRDPVVQQHYQSQRPQSAPPAPRGQSAPGPGMEMQRPTAPQAPAQQGRDANERQATQPPQQGGGQREQPTTRSQGQDKGPQGGGPQSRGSSQDAKQGQDKGQGQGQGRQKGE